MRQRVNNYQRQLMQAKRRFLTYDQKELISRCRLRHDDTYLYLTLLSEPYRIHRGTGDLERLREGTWVDGNSFNEVMTVLDWLCDSRGDRYITGRWINIVTHGHCFHGNLQEDESNHYARLFDRDPAAFSAACQGLRGERLPGADIGYAMELVDGLRVFVQLWHGDEEFSPRLRCLWDENTTRYLRYETTWYATDLLMARIKERMTVMKFDIQDFQWTRQPERFSVTQDRVEIVTRPHTDLWQRTYYHFRNDNAPVFQMETDEKFFSFTVKTEFESKHRFDQCGVVMYLDSENWLKGSIEYENEQFQHLGSVVTNLGYSDWATTAIDASVKSMWYRFSRREDDYCLECSRDGVSFHQMRICHMHKGGGTVRFGIYACSPEDSSFLATFTNMSLTACQWHSHTGQAPDGSV